MKKIFVIIGSVLVMSCTQYLDVVPDNVTTIADAFQNRNYTKNYLYTCYSYLPEVANPDQNPALVAGDEIFYDNQAVRVKYSGNVNPQKIASGQQNSTSPYSNYWDGQSGGRNLWEAIRTCNTFLEYVDTPTDLEEGEKRRWIAEVTFLKAYYHYYLFQLYGPIPIMDANLSLNASTEEVRVHREPVDEVVNYIVRTIDESMEDLPNNITSTINEMGRITKPIALALKAKVLTLAASPLFNGNPDVIHLTDNRGIQLFPDESADKWTSAKVAIKAAIDAAHQYSNAELYRYQDDNLLSRQDFAEPILQALNSRQVVTEKWNSEIIWGSTESTRQIQINAAAKLTTSERRNGSFAQFHSPTMRIAEQFYSSNGVPIDEDRDWVENGWYGNRHTSKLATPEDNHQHYLKTNDYSPLLHFNREARFYGTLGFHNGLWERADEAPYILNGLVSGNAGPYQNEDFSPTGYYSKKLVSIYTKPEEPYGIITEQYSFPRIRLADLYLLYAEVLNEEGATEAEVFEYVDKVRERAGLKGVVESWSNHSINPAKFTSQQGRREIIHQERLIEFALEGERYWDLRRWKKLSDQMNNPIWRWSIYEESVTDYFSRIALEFRTFQPRDYFWPIRLSSIDVNNNLVQNPGW
ncbi:RagB/SusD family nutrient uptake outer membrane protein [Parapedobacter soli]|uniref:RagB/SusD family nutrient uptake outer membrane protein n=1 Tax=Parapedobacter soli TaxID=416955 RepID=UPI0021C5BB57|nr:RagB/SusD family nutrient uptake outer membrane protein [Parapedobacter soli]